jgi:hypothetical protein
MDEQTQAEMSDPALHDDEAAADLGDAAKGQDGADFITTGSDF